MAYQRWGPWAETGERACEDRWAMLRLHHPAHPLTVVDLGAAEGYFSVQCAQTFGDTVIAVDPSPLLLETAQAHPDLPLIVLSHAMTPADLVEFGRCEFVDWLLAMNVLHHFADQAINALEGCLTIPSRELVIETPDIADTGACHAQYVQALWPRTVQTLPMPWWERPVSHTASVPRWLGILRCHKAVLQTPYWHAPVGVQRPGCIYRTTQNGYSVRKGTSWPWIRGINLQTFLALNGLWPTKAALRTAVETYPYPAHHGDIRPWNWIVTGERHRPLRLIDADDFNANDADGIAWTLEALHD